ncbi:MAG TPA: hypothetical protein VGF92_03330 [Stellaceae bacterium]|jgi:hypothetical protein
MNMHDWTLLSILFEWKAGRVVLSFSTHKAGVVELIAERVFELHVPQANDWGPSTHVNNVKGPLQGAAGRARLEIEMQSGDIIIIEATTFEFPPAASADT